MPDRDPLQTLWKEQQQEHFAMSLSDVRARADRFQDRVRMRNFIEYAVGGVVVLAFAWTAFAADGVIARAGAALIALATIYVCWRLHHLARAAAHDERSAAASWAQFHRSELVRQRDALRSVWRWYLGPLAPGLVLFWIGAGLAPSSEAPMLVRLATAALGLGVGAALFYAIGVANARAADSLQREIEAIDRALQSPDAHT